MSNKHTQQAQVFAFESLEAVRNKLLDLSNKNRLLNYKHPSASSLRLVDELPDQIVDILMEGKEMTFLPVPEPTNEELIEAGYIKVDSEPKSNVKNVRPSAEEWAKYKGINPSYDFPDPKLKQQSSKQDKHLQVLLFARELESILRTLRSKAESAIEETGGNILFLAIGFLEWHESKDSELKRIAPLFTLPVNLIRSAKPSKEGIFPYSITLKDEGLLTNLTLKKKLFYDFGVALPELTEDTKPEEYFLSIKETILVRYPSWKLYRQASLVLLDFSKQVIYEDLNPDLWPENSRIDQNSIISHLFGSKCLDDFDNISSSKDYSIDTIENIHSDFPLIYDADNSQHSAIIDVVNGENLVIIGPPGTGKSQTITNLIAALIAKGKSVLFVAEKMAALNVVKNRLDNAGLGDFCLELHSNKTSRQKIIRDLGVRIEMHDRFRKPKDIEIDIQMFENYKEKLRLYVQLINSEWKATGLTLQEIFSRATRYGFRLKINPEVLYIQKMNGNNLTQLKYNEIINNTEILRNLFQIVSQQSDGGNIKNHSWYGVHNANLDNFQTDTIMEMLLQWNNKLLSLKEFSTMLNSKLNFNITEDPSIESLKHINQTLTKLPDVNFPDSSIDLLNLVKQISDFETIITNYEAIHSSYIDLLKVVKPAVILELTTVNNLKTIFSTFRNLGIDDNITLTNFNKLTNTVRAVNTDIQFTHEQFDKIIQNIPVNIKQCFSLTLSGLKEFKKLIGTIKKLPLELWRYRNEIYDNDDMDYILEKMKGLLKTQIPLHNTLYTMFDLNKLPPVGALKRNFEVVKAGGVFKWFSSEWRESRNSIRQLAVAKNIKTKHLIHQMPNLILYKHGNNIMDNLNQEDSILSELYQGIKTPIDRMFSLRKWYKTVREEYGYGFETRKPIGDELLSLDHNLAKSLLNIDKQGLTEIVENVIGKVTELAQIFKGYTSLSDSSVSLSNIFSSLLSECRVVSEMADSILNSTDHTITKLSEMTDKLNIQQQHIKEWNCQQVTKLLNSAGVELSVEINTFNSEKLTIAKNLLKIVEIISNEPWLMNSLAGRWRLSHYQELRQSQDILNKYLKDVDLVQMNFLTFSQVELDVWLQSTDNKLEKILLRNQKAINNTNWLPTWLEYARLCMKLTTEGMHNIIAEFENNSIKIQDIVQVVQFVIYNQLAKEILTENQFLAMFSSMEQEAISKMFKEYDYKLMTLQRELVAFKADQVTISVGVSSGKVKDFTDLSLIRHNLALKRPKIAIRSLLQRAGSTVKALKPCFMMSPVSVAQYLVPGQLKFDVVVMDEASQIRPEDALGSIARGKKLLVVGDPKQLPPTSFFQKLADEVDDESTALEQTESILETLEPIFKNRLLKWHYRSQHQKLIAFSNQKFYDSRLVIFPSPFNSSEELGIYYHRIHDGCFVDRRNIEEAKAVALAAAEQLLKNPKDSVGIVAMNLEQSAELEIQIEKIIKNQPIYQDAFMRNQKSEEPLFIKNLESVQGDERDVIILSMTYGPDNVGAKSMYQRFGPINSSDGWRRLNVLLTRSKKRMLVYSSMDSDFIHASETSSRGVQALKAWLAYCESGHLIQPIHTNRDPDSDFEIAVMSALSQHGYHCEPQLGEAGYFIDLAVIDPNMPGRFLMGIECDGATYHSAKSTRERDRLRQEILERLGWRIRRIWSTDWFRNPNDQIASIIKELDDLKKRDANIS